jgi:hypothetical protein
MQQHVRTTMFLHPTMNFNLTKNLFLYVFMSTKNTKLNHFNYISKEVNFRVLQKINKKL